MNCEFCQKPLQYSHQENKKEVEVHECLSCPVMFHYFIKDGTRIKTVFLIDKNKRVYLWTNDYINNSTYIQSAAIDKMNPADCYLFKSPKIIPVTPDNVRSKFSLYMMFI